MENVLTTQHVFACARPFRGAAKITALTTLITLTGVAVQPAKTVSAGAAVPAPSANLTILPKPKLIPAAVIRLKRVIPTKNMMSGIASWYGKVLQGHRTASGERFDPSQLTAAHRTLPFGTMVRVTDLSNHRSVVVKITDRGALNPDRVIDLSYAAADKLAMVKAGTHPVSLEVVPNDAPSAETVTD